jgi:hypothetical protein
MQGRTGKQTDKQTDTHTNTHTQPAGSSHLPQNISMLHKTIHTY